MHQFVSVNRTSLGRIYESTDDYKLGDDKRCLRYNIDDLSARNTTNEFICPKDACLPEFPPTNPSWRTCKRKCHNSPKEFIDRSVWILESYCWTWKRWNSFHKKTVEGEMLNEVCECHFNGNTPMCGFDGFECEPSLGLFPIISRLPVVFGQTSGFRMFRYCKEFFARPSSNNFHSRTDHCTIFICWIFML